MKKTLNKEIRLRSYNRNWATSEELDDENIYKGHYTIDPSKVGDSWTVFGKDLFFKEVSMYPAVLHVALLNTLRRRSNV